MTIKDQILQELIEGKRLTQLTMLIRFKTMAGTQRVNELRREYPEIQARTIVLDSGKRVSEYYWQTP